MIDTTRIRCVFLFLAAVGALWLHSLPAAAGEPVQIVKLLSNDLPLYSPASMAEVKRLPASKVPLPVKASMNEMGMYDAVINGSKYWINPADVVTSAAAELEARCHANAENQGTSSSARAFGSGCQ